MSPWDMLWWEWFALAGALFIVRRIIYSDHPMAFTIRFCLLVATLLSVVMGVVRLAHLI
ncbi:MAG: hypothetical protein WAL85_08825 [Candidatus Korobacteraceae bacterium]